jgi:hypothetical protein
MIIEEEAMKLSTTSFVSVLALAAFVCASSGALAEPPDPCKSGCLTSRGQVINYLNPQPLPPGIKGPGHGGSTGYHGGSTGYIVTPSRKTIGSATGGAGAGKIR